MWWTKHKSDPKPTEIVPKTYTIPATCPNCIGRITVEIPVGTPSKGWEFNCPRCEIALVAGDYVV